MTIYKYDHKMIAKKIVFFNEFTISVRKSKSI